MNLLSPESLAAYWSAAEVETNIIVFFNLLGAMLLGLVVGYERAYHGRAAGMRTYALVCMASAALTVVAGYPNYWFGGHSVVAFSPDPTRTIQGIVTGVGFIGAGVIMKEGFNISGLTTAASIWTASAIGILDGLGFYAAAILLTLLAVLGMMWGSKIEGLLPSRPAIAIQLRFRKGFAPHMENLERAARKRGYEIAHGTLAVSCQEGRPEWHFVAIGLSRRSGESIPALAEELAAFEGVEDFHLSHARN
jgi:putative Mg2+ transporter-C (MgtC) family protein